MFAFSDLIPTKSLVIFMEHTGLDEDSQLFRVGNFHIAPHCRYVLLKVTDALIEQTADIIKALPDLKDAMVNPPDLEWPRLRCVLSIKNEDLTKPDHVQVQAWCMMNLREVCYGLDKDYSHAASRLAIPQLLNEVNILREPQQAERRFRFMVLDPDLSWALLQEIAENETKEPFQQDFE
jgi:hypothetical protein